MVGAYSIAVIDKENPDLLIGSKLGSPMVVGMGSNGIFLSSDINALGNIATEFTTLEDREMVVIQNGSFQVYARGEEIEKEIEAITEELGIADK
jgi:glucosamine--fructose-6-phosphate aminotransferase (isomerizing)